MVCDPFSLVGSQLEAIIMGLICGLMFYKIPHKLVDIHSTQAGFYMLVVRYSYLFFLLEIYQLMHNNIQLFD